MRDYFAAKLIQAWVSRNGFACALDAHAVAKNAYAMADAILAERAK